MGNTPRSRVAIACQGGIPPIHDLTDLDINELRVIHIQIARVPLGRDLGYRSKLDRRPEFLRELKEYGMTKSRWFLQERESRKYAMAALGTISSNAAYD